MRYIVLVIAILALALAPAAQAGKITVSATYDGTYIDLTVCGTGSKTVEVRVIHPDGSVQVGQFVNTIDDCFDWNDAFLAPESGTYTVEVGNLSHKNTFASTTVTVP